MELKTLWLHYGAILLFFVPGLFLVALCVMRTVSPQVCEPPCACSPQSRRFISSEAKAGFANFGSQRLLTFTDGAGTGVSLVAPTKKPVMPA